MDSSAQTTLGMYLDSFEKQKNELVWPFLIFLAILFPKSIVGRLYQVLAILSGACVTLIGAYEFLIFLRNGLFVLVFACVISIPINRNRHDFQVEIQ